ncbi:hypothetical protein E7T09_04380 [Deinococcus sp. KSM4-11]|uniref:hypothetical protein n=1 Tax=Deinococcus sp. KSM4-11 TaxID=2568654 RepID=UPI0010A2E606|nr:hypothetical protein [Deinococcus sp. KSM4-11]THF88448.1 hypothetical protein E7T09_04380 [Deinococcus sp. KSM4-11]
MNPRITWACVALIGVLRASVLSPAQATTLDFGVAYRSGGTGVLDSGWARIGLSELRVLGGTAQVGVSSRALDAGYTRSLTLPPLGAVTSSTDLAVTYAGGVRLTSRANASVGPIALSGGGSFFTTSATSVDPLAAWTATPTDLRASGWTADVTARYRVNRTLVAVLGGEFGSQAQGFGGVEGRHDLTRTLPPAEDDDPDAPPETEVTGTLTWRVGARVGRNVLGATAGVGYSTPDGVTLTVDGLLGPSSLGLTAGVSAADVLGAGSTLRLYGAYEPWRSASAPLRVGVDYGLPLGSGTLNLTVSGGRDLAGQVGVGARIGYGLDLNAATPDSASP